MSLDFDFLRQVFIFLPSNRAANSALIQVITLYVKVIAVSVLFREDRIFEIFVGREVECDQEPCGRPVKELKGEVNQMAQGILVSIGDEFAESDVIFECGEPKFGDAGLRLFGIRVGGISGKGRGVRVVFEGLSFACLDFLFRRLC